MNTELNAIMPQIETSARIEALPTFPSCDTIKTYANPGDDQDKDDGAMADKDCAIIEQRIICHHRIADHTDSDCMACQKSDLEGYQEPQVKAIRSRPMTPTYFEGIKLQSPPSAPKHRVMQVITLSDFPPLPFMPITNTDQPRLEPAVFKLRKRPRVDEHTPENSTKRRSVSFAQ